MVHPRSSEALSELSQQPESSLFYEGMECKADHISPISLHCNMHLICKESRPADVEGTHGRTEFNQDGINDVIEAKVHQELERMSPNPTANTTDMEDIQGRTEFNQDWINATEKVIEPKADQKMEWMSLNPTITEDMECLQARTGFNQDGINAIIEAKPNPEKERMSPNPTLEYCRYGGH